MMKRLVAIALTGALLSLSVCEARDIVSHTLASLVLIEFEELDETSVMHSQVCTGFMVAPRKALTAAHCAPEGSPLKADGAPAPVLVRSLSFALLEAGNKPALKIAKEVRIQEEVVSFGYAWGAMLILRRHVAAFKGGDFAIDGRLAPGMSGGPAVNLSGEVVGIHQASNDVIGILCGPGELREFVFGAPTSPLPSPPVPAHTLAVVVR